MLVSKRVHKQDTGYLKIDTILWVLWGVVDPSWLLSTEHYSRETRRPDELLKVGGIIRF